MTEKFVGKNLGKYQIVARLGQGGMAEVYKAYQPGLDRHVAVKIMHSHIAAQSGSAERFEREAVAVARLHHPHIVQVYDFDLQEDLYYMVMEFIEGPTLRSELAERGRNNQTFTLSEIVPIFSALTGAVDYAHAQGVVHHDLKPDNAMITPLGQLVLTDFGLAQMMEVTTDLESGEVRGTPAYIAPEQAQGQRGDKQSDIYSLGVMLYELVTGKLPFHSDRPLSVMLMHIKEPPPPPTEFRPDLPPAVEQVILKALAKEPAKRYTRAGEMMQALWEAMGLSRDESAAALIAAIAASPEIREVALTPDRPPLSSSAPPPPCPYRGLFAFREADAPFFFGREAFVAQLMAAVRQQPMVAVLGPSGSGKSSVVFAGLLPRLRQKSGGWLVDSIRPGAQPFRALAEALVSHLQPDLSEAKQTVETDKLAQALRRGERTLADLINQIGAGSPADSRYLLVIDQFEELYSICPEAETRRRFANQLLDAIDARQRYLPDAAINNFTLVLTMRADFLGQALGHRAFADALQAADIKLGPMTAQELDRAIENPAGRQGVLFETGLAARILDDVGEESGNLPLLQFALTLLWERQDRGLLTHAAYEAIGRVEGALAHYADQVYAQLSPAQQIQARRLFTQLVRPGEGTEDTRRLATRPELGEASWNLGRRLADARLVVTGRNTAGQETAEVVHEALIRGWKKLRDWMTADRTFRSWQERLRVTCRQWENSNRDEGALLRGTLLAEAEGWLAERGHDLSQAERIFIKDSIALREQKQIAQEQQRRRVIMSLTTGLGLAVIGLIVVLILTVVAGFGWRQAGAEANRAEQERQQAETARQEAVQQQATAEAAANTANQQRQIAEEQRQAALARQLMAQAINYTSSEPDLALLLSLEADRLTPASGPATYHTLLSALGAQPHLLTSWREHIASINTVAFSPDGKILASAGDDDVIILWDVKTGQPRHPPLVGHTEPINTVAFNPEGTLLASASDDGTIILWDVARGRPRLKPLTGHTDWVNDVAFSSDGNLLASAGAGQTVILWEVDTGQIRRRLTGHTGAVGSVAFSPTRPMLASAGDNGTIILWNPESGQQLGEPLIGHTDMVMSLVFSPDGRFLASGDRDSVAMLWDLTSRPYRRFGRPLTEHNNTVLNLAFSPDGRTLATCGWDKTIILWDVSTQKPIGEPLSGHTEGVSTVAFHPDGQTLASGGLDRTIMLWDLSRRQRLAEPLAEQSAEVLDLAFSPDGQTLASASDDETIILWDVAQGQAIGSPLDNHTNWVQSVAFSPDGQTLASASDDNSIILWDADQGIPLGSPLEGHTGGVLDLAFEPTGQTLVSASADSNIILWDVATRQQIRQFSDYPNRIWGVAFSPDGQTLAAGGDDKTVMLWDVASGERLGAPLAGHSQPIYDIAFSPDGQTLASASNDTQIILWDVANRDSPNSAGQALVGHTDSVLSVTFSPDGQTLASGSWDNTIILWDVARRQPLGSPLVGHTAPVNSVVFRADGRILASGSSDGLVQLWNLQADPPLLSSLNGHQQVILSTAISPDGQTLASGSTEGPISLWDIETGELVTELTGHTDWVESLAFSPDGELLASASDDETLILWDVKQGEMESQFTGHNNWVNDVAFSPDGQMLASADSDGLIILWDSRSGKEVDRLTGYHTADVNDVSFSPDGKIVASASDDETVILWDVEQGRIRGQPLQGHENEIYAVAFSPDGRVLASGSADTTIRLWDVATGNPLAPPLTNHISWIDRILFSTDGKMMFSAGGEGEIIVWDVDSWQPIGPPLAGHTASIQSLSISPNGHTLVSSGSDGAIIRWDVDPASWKVKACQTVARNLTWPEWQQFLPDQPYQPTCPDVPLQLNALLEQADTYAQAGMSEQAAATYRQVLELTVPTKAGKINNNLCWLGSLNQQAEVVMPACDQAVALAPAEWEGLYRDSRGVARALVGDYEGAIEDFEFFMQWTRQYNGYDQLRIKRHAWLRLLREGQNPFDAATLDMLRNE